MDKSKKLHFVPLDDKPVIAAIRIVDPIAEEILRHAPCPVRNLTEYGSIYFFHF